MPLTFSRRGFSVILFCMPLGLTPIHLRAATSAADVREKVLRQLEHSRALNATLDAWTARRKELREEFLKGAGLWPLPERQPLNVIIHSRREHDGYSAENVALETMPGFFCTGNL